MRIKQIIARNYFQFPTLSIELPERGLVVVQGRNGQGKSAIVDAPAVAGWGSTLRGREWWKKDKAASVEIVTHDDLRFLRERAAKGKQLNSWTKGGVTTRPDTVTKGQPELDRLIGELMPWRSSHVFSSRDASKFAGITDAQRKRLLEAFLGNAVLDAASKLVKVDLKAVNGQVQSHSGKLEIISDRLEQLRSELAMAEDFIASLPTPLDAAECARVQELEAAINLAEQAIAKQRTASDMAQAVLDAPEEWRGLAAKAAEAEREHRHATAGCEKCKQPVACGCVRDPKATLKAQDAAQAASAKAVAADREARGMARTIIGMARTTIATLGAQKTDAVQARDELLQRDADAESHAPRKAELTTRIAELRLDIGLADEEYTDLLTICHAAEREAEVLALVDKTLGLSGIRTILLGRTLDNITKLSNLALSQLSAGEARLELKSYTEGKGGAMSDAIALKVYGWADDRGYDQLSDGQQRVIDLALLIGTGLVAEAAQGQSNGTMFFDEAFDALDDEVAPRAGALIAELSESRCCVVISHSEKVIGSMRPQVILHVENGRILEL